MSAKAGKGNGASGATPKNATLCDEDHTREG